MRLMQMLAGAPQGGAETFFVSLAAGFARWAREGRAELDQLTAIRPNAARAEALRAAGASCVEMPFGGRLDLTTRPRLRGLAHEFAPDLVLAYMNRAAAFMPSGDFLKLARLGGYYDLKYYRRCDHLLCITADIRRHVVDRGWPAERAHVMPNFATLDAHPAEPRGAQATPEDVPLILVPSRLHQAKGLDTLLQALAQVPDACLWLAGEGPQRGQLEELTDRLGLRDRVRFLGWRSDRGALYRACDLVAFPSRYEPFGTVSLEAWAYGKPLVAADAAGPAGLVRHGEDALLVPREDPIALAGALRRVLEDRALAERLAQAGHARYKADYTEDACVQRYLRLFERLTGRPVLRQGADASEEAHL
jgi:glycosyltransferase involved in cell wall biosynthesis